MPFKKNEGIADRLMRLVVAIILLVVAYFWTAGVLSIVLYVVAAVLLFTAATGFCALYVPFKVSTHKPKHKTDISQGNPK